MDCVLTLPIAILTYYTVCEKTERKGKMVISKVVLVLLLAGVADGEIPIRHCAACVLLLLYTGSHPCTHAYYATDDQGIYKDIRYYASLYSCLQLFSTGL